MTSLVPGGGWLPLKAFALALGACVFLDPPALAGGDGGPGTQGYAFQGFGLGYHPGFGYGGAGLGVGVGGGYPFYGGPGYPHCDPSLRRLPGITPFPYFGGLGYPTASHPNYFGAPGPLVAERPVVTIRDGSELDYGGFSGGPPNAEAVFAPFTTVAAASGSYGGETYQTPAPGPGVGESSPSTPPLPGALPIPPGAARPLGIETEPVVGAGGVRGLKVFKVGPGTAAEKAGLHSGDVIHAINGYSTTQRDNLAWVIANAAPDHVLSLVVRTASDGKERTIKAELR